MMSSDTSITIEAYGSTTLVWNGNNCFLDGTDGSSVELSYDGVAIVAGQFGAWAPIGATKTTSGYDVAWKEPGTTSDADQYTV